MIYRPGPRRVLEGGSLVSDFLSGTIVGAVSRLEGQAREMEQNALSAAAAERSYVRAFRQMVFDGWGRQDVAAGLSNAVLSRFGNAWQSELRMGVSGSVVALGVWLNAARSVDSCTVTVWVGGAATELAATLDEDAPWAALETATAGAVAFEADEEIALRVTTGAAWAPATGDLQAWIVVSLDVE
jgi:hypothetical protein